MSEHTPGPWFADGVVVVDHEGGSLGEMTPGFPGMPINEMEANTRLAAAAPDMLEALRMIRNNWAGHSEVCETVLRRHDGKCDCDWPKVAAQCDAAILKATTSEGDTNAA